MKKIRVKQVAEHVPVMLNEVLQILAPGVGKRYLDCTFGRGGHTKSLLKYGATVVGIDRDFDAYKAGRALQSLTSNFSMHWSVFSEIVYHCGKQKFDGILFDFGLSSNQIQDPEKGMSFMQDAPLRMTMGKNDITAFEVVNYGSQSLLENIILNLGEEPNAAKIVKGIINFRRTRTINTTKELADLIHSLVPRRGKDPATQTFQAIRMYVNDELNEIYKGISQAVLLLKPGGKLVTITFHSLEDRIVKNFFKQFKCKSKPIFPTFEELRSNRRSHSAKLRFARVF